MRFNGFDNCFFEVIHVNIEPFEVHKDYVSRRFNWSNLETYSLYIESWTNVLDAVPQVQYPSVTGEQFSK